MCLFVMLAQIFSHTERLPTREVNEVFRGATLRVNPVQLLHGQFTEPTTLQSALTGGFQSTISNLTASRYSKLV
jgi:hypothetical protein